MFDFSAGRWPKMKKKVALLIWALLIALLTGCGNKPSPARTGNQPSGVSQVLESKTAEQYSINETAGKSEESSAEDTEDKRQTGVNEGAPVPEVRSGSETAAAGADGIDIYLTTLSSTMVYSEVWNMLVYPENYVGKTVKMNGALAIYHDEDTDKNYFACVISDATACCSQGIEFALTDDYKYPDDYPEEGGEICVTGVFDTYEEDGYMYCTLRDARIV